MLNLIYDWWSHLLVITPKFNNILWQNNELGVPITNCWGFGDGKVHAICSPGTNQYVLYNRHKIVHRIKFKSVVAPNRLLDNLFVPVESWRHDSDTLAKSELHSGLKRYSVPQDGYILVIYGYLAYQLRPQDQRPFQRGQKAPLQKQWNKAMSSIRVSVEWAFGHVINYYI